MNDLGYKLLVSKSVRRKTTILSMLSESSTPIPLESLWIACQSRGQGEQWNQKSNLRGFL